MARNAYKLVLVGSGGVGKSCLTIQYISKKFVEDYDPTLEDSYRKQVTLESGEPAVLDIFDTAGQEDFQAVRDSYIRTGDGFLCVYSVTLQASFDEAVNLHSHINRVKDVEESPFVLIGNKCDLEDARQVPFEKGQSLASDLSCPFLETSAKTRFVFFSFGPLFFSFRSLFLKNDLFCPLFFLFLSVRFCSASVLFLCFFSLIFVVSKFSCSSFLTLLLSFFLFFILFIFLFLSLILIDFLDTT